MQHPNLPHDDLLLNVRKDLVSEPQNFKNIDEDHFKLSEESTKSLETLLKESEKKDKGEGFKLRKTEEAFNKKLEDLDKQIFGAIKLARNPLLVQDSFTMPPDKTKGKSRSVVVRFKNDAKQFERPSEASKKIIDTVNPSARYERSAIDDIEEREPASDDKGNRNRENNNGRKRVKFDSCPEEDKQSQQAQNYFKKYRNHDRGANPKCVYKKFDYYNLSNVEYDQNLTVSSAFDFLRDLEQREKRKNNPSIEEEIGDMSLSKPVFNKKVIKKKMINEENAPVRNLKHKMAVLSFQDEL